MMELAVTVLDSTRFMVIINRKFIEIASFGTCVPPHGRGYFFLMLIISKQP
jgi:hypothetical protein